MKVSANKFEGSSSSIENSSAFPLLCAIGDCGVG
jgi:hypothetical protein